MENFECPYRHKIGQLATGYSAYDWYAYQVIKKFWRL